MHKKNIPIIAIVGWSKSGKTTFLAKLIQVAVKKGYKVAAIKHTHHKIEEKKKDTSRLREAGADPVLLVSKGLIVMTKKMGEDAPLENIVEKFFDSVDIIFVEGFKSSKFPKIEVFSEKEGPLYEKDKTIFALISSKAVGAEIPTFSPEEVEKVMDFIVHKFFSVL
ncbi:MAG: molybdopterin-guanine dinucleotide biosynthesis protein B [Deltaproteobacteria bacterium]|nr:molybdopterin-guanine dinucleotide biosynthesis protein B [Deltaproteobacteria bacterium]